MKTKFKKSGYSSEIANEYINNKKAIRCLSTELDPQYKFIDKKRTEDIACFIAWFTQEGLPPFKVKFKSQITLTGYMSIIQFKNLEACEVNYNVYFIADDIVEVK
ncbi:hypothetical protein ACQUD9_08590 [Vagococcus fluvialis]|uniref:hypothetical protein n=1 Tax=Vagococcus fluvialis TaxID=2738 RepID=UPI003D0B1A9F